MNGQAINAVVPQSFWFGFAVAISLAAFTAVVAYHLTERTLMSINEALAGLKSQLSEASAEIVAKITELESQISESETVDPQLLDDVKALASNLADIVPNAVAGEELTDTAKHAVADLTDNVSGAIKPIVPGADLSGVRVSGSELTDSVGADLTDAE